MTLSIRILATSLLVAGFAATLTGCGDGQSLSKSLGLVHDAPDEFSVTTRAPLAMPPTFALPPPRPGAVRPQEQTERAKAEEALVPTIALGAPPPGNSPGQEALVQQAGPPVANNIRSEVDQEAVNDRPSQGVMDKLMFWRKPEQPGIVVDPSKEAQRLRENSALGHNPETGDTPIVQPKQRAWLEGIF
jgi:hypothetical protein